MTIDWKTYNVKDVADFLNGYPFKSKELSQDPSGVPVIKMGNLAVGGGVNLSIFKSYFTGPLTDKIKKSFAKKYDLLMCMTDMKASMNLLGYSGQVMESDLYLVNQRVGILRPKNNAILDNRFFYYVMNSAPVVDYLQQHANSGVQVNLTADSIKNTPIVLPPLATQKQIAAILGRIDEKINTNTAINNNLEQQAQALFKSWFVDFEPFGGTAPENWEEHTLTDIPYFTLLKPGIKSFDGEKYYVATADADKDGITNKTTFVTMQNKPSRANMQPLVDSVWFAKMKNSRKNILINKLWAEEINKFILSTGFYGFSCDQNTLYYLWCFIASDAFDELKNNLCNGTTMEAINNDGLGQISLNVPPLESIQNFNRQVAPMFEMIVHNKFENERLANIRDALLPKLMSGEIDVSNVDISNIEYLDKSLFNKETE